ncbi:polysaccharide deacetylase family protein [Chromatocurvus halotolerans]|uniref:Polysaccharide deacetylase n=1 Tax=Chromatocurvus halotolerans TaxID=1132028 RepID=A0A4R2KZN5_9GAMM|nr:polysaccharide deacetylase family protein [Chromatocurvus halotolerans]TCO78397.1 polysaccharide deacetylase [Chromatocurvus halotolerans]
MRRPLLTLLACILAVKAAADHGVILMYHHVDERTPASTSVTPAQFRQHLDFIEENGFAVVPLPVLLDSVYHGGTLPANAVAITFDDAYESVYREAFPELQSRNMPFTVFVATDAVDQQQQHSLSWEQMRDLADSGLAAFGAHSVTHSHLLQGSERGASKAWVARVEAEVDDSVARLETELPGTSVTAFAYPFGEYSAALEAVLASRNLYGLAQQSGAVGRTTPATGIPRFPMATGYDSTTRLATALNARPLPVSDVEAGDTLIAQGDAAPDSLRFKLPADGPYRRDALACYSSSGDALTISMRDTTVTVALPDLRPGRNKINCTAPSTEKSGEFFWYSRQWVVADSEGAWLSY